VCVMAQARHRKWRSYRRPTLEERPFVPEELSQRLLAFNAFASESELKTRGVDPWDRGTILSAMLQPLERLPVYLRKNPSGRGYIY